MKTVGLDPTTVREAGAIMAKDLGLSWPEDRKEIVDYINDFRDRLYNMYSDLRLFDNVSHCIELSTFPVECGHACGARCFTGFVLPPDVVSIEAAYDYGRPLTLRSRWREALVGQGAESLPRVEVTETAGLMSTERAMSRPTELKMFSDSSADAGKDVFIQVVLADTGETKTLRFKLIDDGWCIVARRVREIISVSLPSGFCGNISLAEKDGRVLSVYAPHESVPAYRLFRMASSCRSGTLLIQGVKRFVPVSFDHDVVEVGSRTVLKAAASFLRFRNGTTEAKDLSRAEYDKTDMGILLNGLFERHQGQSHKDGPSLFQSPNTSKILPGYR